MRFVNITVILFAAVLLNQPAFAQPQEQQDHSQHAGAHSLFDPREASGTSWQPPVTPMFGIEREAAGWTFMLHGNAFVQYLYESGEEHRTSKQFGSINWFMGMARRSAGSGRVGLHAMMSLEPLTISGCGYPDLLATGEQCDGDTIHDRQHPHDLFMELAADYDRPIAGALRWQIYGGLAGEPAIGPPGFPHRLSAFPNPIASIGHHWMDSTHVTFGLITTGIYGAKWKTEVSAFNGREPDESRGGIDLAPLDSLSGRVWWLPAPGLALQLSAGHLEEAEAALGSLPAADVDRITASATYHRSINAGGYWAATLAYGTNAETAALPEGPIDERTHAAMLESSFNGGGPHTWFGRIDIGGKPAHDLHVHEHETEVFTVGKLQGGYVFHWPAWKGLQPGIGATVSFSIVPATLAPRYGGQVAPGFGVFFNVQPARHRM